MAGASWGAWHYYVSTQPPVHREKVTLIDGREPRPGADFP